MWALLFPASFYNDFVFGRGWVRPDGAYNEHLIIGGLNLAPLHLSVASPVVGLDGLVPRPGRGISSPHTVMTSLPRAWPSPR